MTYSVLDTLTLLHIYLLVILTYQQFICLYFQESIIVMNKKYLAIHLFHQLVFGLT